MIKTPARQNWIENKNFVLVPEEDQNFWKVRILTGDFIETVFQYGTVKFDQNNHTVSFTYEVVYTPDPSFDLQTAEFKKVASDILHSLLIGLMDDK